MRGGGSDSLSFLPRSASWPIHARRIYMQSFYPFPATSAKALTERARICSHVSHGLSRRYSPLQTGNLYPHAVMRVEEGKKRAKAGRARTIAPLCLAVWRARSADGRRRNCVRQREQKRLTNRPTMRMAPSRDGRHKLQIRIIYYSSPVRRRVHCPVCREL